MNQEELEKSLSRIGKFFYDLVNALSGDPNQVHHMRWTMVYILLFLIVKLIVGVMFLVYTSMPPYLFFRPFYYIGKFYIVGYLLLAVVDTIGDIKGLSVRNE